MPVVETVVAETRRSDGDVYGRWRSSASDEVRAPVVLESRERAHWLRGGAAMTMVWTMRPEMAYQTLQQRQRRVKLLSMEK